MNSIKILITAIIYTGISSGIAFAISYYANIHLVLCLIIANIINLSIWLSDNVKKDEKMDIFFSNLKVVETDNKISELVWSEHLSGDQRIEWFHKVATDAPDSELKLKYQQLVNQRTAWERKYHTQLDTTYGSQHK